MSMRQYLRPMEVPVVSGTILQYLQNSPNEPCYLTLDFKKTFNDPSLVKPHLFQMSFDQYQDKSSKMTTFYNSFTSRKPSKSVQCPRNMMYQSFYAKRKAHKGYKEPNKIDKTICVEDQKRISTRSPNKRYSVLDYLPDINIGENLTLNGQYQPFKSLDIQSRKRQKNQPNNPFQINFKNKKKLADSYSPRSRAHKKGNSLFQKLVSIAYEEDQGYPQIKPTIKGQIGTRMIDPHDKDVYKIKQKKKIQTKVVQL